MNVFDLVAKISLDSSEYDKGLDDASNRGSSVGSKLSKGFGVLAKGTAVALGGMATGLGVVGKNAMQAYAQYEQLTGGVEKLFGDAGDQVVANSKKAFATAQMSANDYMSMATTFSASLINSLGGDTEKAAKYADIAIRDMSDNASIMGTDMEMIQNAYSGFSRGNFTMLDNLKLGFAGTKTGMQDLLKAANEYNAAQGKHTDYQIDSYADIVEAIHVVQENMQIAGNTEKEAMRTLEGSANMTKASWQNVLTAISSGEGLEQAFNDLTLSIFGDGSEGTGLLNNIIPRLEKVMDGIGAFVGKAAPYISEYIPQLIEAVVPSLVENAAKLVIALAEGLIASIPTLIDTGKQLMRSLADGLEEEFPLASDAINLVVDAFEVLIDGIKKAVEVGKEISDWASEHKTLLEVLGGAVAILTAAIVAYNVAQAIANAGGVGMIALYGLMATAQGIQTAATVASTVATTAATVATTAFGAVLSFLTSPITLVVLAIGALIAIGVALYKNWDTIKEKASALGEFLSEKWDEISGAAKEKWNAIKETMSNAMSAASDYVKGKLDKIKKAYEDNGGGLKGIAAATMEGIKQYYSVGYDAINKLTGGKLDEIRNKFSSVFENVKNVVRNALDTIKGMFNFSWSLPQIKLPHFNVRGGKAPWGFGGKGSLPSVSVDWYAKAMDSGMILDSPTIFGMSNGNLLGAGEAGAEVVVGRDSLYGMIQKAVDGRTDGIVTALENVLSYLQEQMPQMANTEIVLDTGTLVGTMDRELGKNTARRARYV